MRCDPPRCGYPSCQTVYKPRPKSIRSGCRPSLAEVSNIGCGRRRLATGAAKRTAQAGGMSQPLGFPPSKKRGKLHYRSGGGAIGSSCLSYARLGPDQRKATSMEPSNSPIGRAWDCIERLLSAPSEAEMEAATADLDASGYHGPAARIRTRYRELVQAKECAKSFDDSSPLFPLCHGPSVSRCALMFEQALLEAQLALSQATTATAPPKADTPTAQVDPTPSASSSSPASRLAVMFDPDQAILDGTPYALKSNGAVFLYELLKADGDWVTGATIGIRADRAKDSLPPAIRQLIESAPGKGNRLRLNSPE